MAALIKKVQKYCDEHGMRFTAPRQLVLDVIINANSPIGAYDIIEEIAKITDRPNPTTIYRATEFLTEHGFIHKIESLNAFVTCDADHLHKGTQFIICQTCKKVEEIHICSMPDTLREQSKKIGFTLSHWTAELHGLCNTCSA